MTTRAVFIKKIWQLDNTRFAIQWTDASVKAYALADLQRQCPCAACKERKADELPISDELRANAIRSVGRYALRVDFSTGCSNGIFHFDRLYEMGSPLSSEKQEECCL